MTLRLSVDDFKKFQKKSLIVDKEPRKTRKKETAPRRQIEGKLQRKVGKYLRTNFLLLKLPNVLFFTYSCAGEYKTKKTAGLQKAKGAQKGDWDYRFEVDIDGWQHTIHMEAKSPTGDLTKEQKALRKRKEGLKNVRFYVFESYWEFIEILKKEKIIL